MKYRLHGVNPHKEASDKDGGSPDGLFDASLGSFFVFCHDEFTVSPDGILSSPMMPLWRSAGIRTSLRPGNRPIVIALAVFCSLVLLGACGTRPKNDNGSHASAQNTPSNERSEAGSRESRTITELQDRAEQQGRVDVIVRLDVDVAPEGELSEDGVDRQRRSIQSAQDRLLSALEGTRFMLLHRYRVSPLLALSLSPEGVAVVEDHPIVRGVTLDTRDAPSGDTSSLSVPSRSDTPS